MPVKVDVTKAGLFAHAGLPEEKALRLEVGVQDVPVRVSISVIASNRGTLVLEKESPEESNDE